MVKTNFSQKNRLRQKGERGYIYLNILCDTNRTKLAIMLVYCAMSENNINLRKKYLLRNSS